MFLCEKCHQESNCQMGFIEGLSRGECESCGKVATCYDCHGYMKFQRKDYKTNEVKHGQ
jgi:hypothetical protein